MAVDQGITYQPEEELTTPQERIKKLKKSLKDCQRQKEEYLRQAQRIQADWINYRRRQEESLKEIKIHYQAEIIRELLGVLDSLELAEKQTKKVKPIKEQLQKILSQYQLEKIKAEGERFDPSIHEAVDQVKAKGKSGLIVKEIQKGYLLQGKVLRTSKVIVAK